jgi:hypothetical protein
MAFFPSEDVARAWTQAREARAWAGVQDEVWSAFQLQTGPLGDDAAGLRNIALLPPNALRAALTATRVLRTGHPGLAAITGHEAGERALFPIEASQIGFLWRLCRRLGGAWDAYSDLDSLSASLPIRTAAEIWPVASTRSHSWAAWRHAYAVWLIPNHPDSRGVHTGGDAAWEHLSQLFPGGDRPHVFGVKLRRFESTEEALVGYAREAANYSAPLPVPTHLH